MKKRQVSNRLEQDREDDDDNNEGELGRCFHQAYMIEAWSRGRTPMTLANEDTSGRPSTNEDIANKPRRITRAQQSTHGDVRSKPRWTTKTASS